MIRQVCEKYKTLSTSRKIGISICVNMIVMVILIGLALFIEFKNVKDSQMELPESFFESFQKESLESVAQRSKQFVLALVDYRVPFISGVANMLLDNSDNLTLRNQTILSPENLSAYSNKIVCIFYQRETIFNCDMDPMAKEFLESGWPYNSHRSTRNARRFSIIYQNKNDINDVMIYSISDVQDIDLRSNPNIIPLINITLNGIEKGFLQFSSFYPDQLGESSSSLVSFHTKMPFKNYNTLIQIETFGGFLKASIQRIIYTDSMNILVLEKNETSESGYNLVSYINPPEEEIDYRDLLAPGYKKFSYFETKQNTNKEIYSFTIMISSVYELGHISLGSKENINENYALIIHTPSISQKPEEKSYEIIQNLYLMLLRFITVFSFLLYSILVTNVFYWAYQIGKKLKIIKNSLKKYMEKPYLFVEVSKNLCNESFKEYWFGSLMRSISDTIRAVESNKKQFRTKTEKVNYNKFPLNLLEPNFIKQENWTDLERFEEIEERIRKNHPEKKKSEFLKEKYNKKID